MSMTIVDQDHFDQVRAWAEQHGCLDQLQKKLDYLTEYSDEPTTCELYRDFAPHSFEFVMKRADGSRWFNGGLIYSGPGQPLDGSFPALTVSINNFFNRRSDAPLHDWSVHT